MALELQEEKKAQIERERRLKEQEQKIESLSTMVINSAVDDRDIDRRNKKVIVTGDWRMFASLSAAKLLALFYQRNYHTRSVP